MSRVRALDVNHDWQFGKGQNDYKTENKAVAQNINTRLLAFLGDCFFDSGSGVDWFNLIGSKELLPLKLQIAATILNTPNVTGLNQPITAVLDSKRNLSIKYDVQTTYSQVTGTFQYDVNGLNGL